MSRGVFITFEGGDGSGKSTQIAALSQVLADAGMPFCVLREPGGTRISEEIRRLLLNPELEEMSAVCELLLYEAARAQLVSQRIEPAISAGQVVLCDRFSTSTLAYQGYGRGIDLEIIRQANSLACGSCVPDGVILLLVAAQEGIKRASQDGADRIENAGNDFHDRVNRGFVELAQEDPRIHAIQPGSRQDTLRAVVRAIHPLLPSLDVAAIEQRLGADPAHYFKDLS